MVVELIILCSERYPRVGPTSCLTCKIDGSTFQISKININYSVLPAYPNTLCCKIQWRTAEQCYFNNDSAMI